MTIEDQLLDIWDNMAFVRLLRTFKLSIAPTRVIIALAAVIIVCFSGWVMDYFTMSVTIDRRYPAKLTLAEFSKPNSATELDQYITNPDSIDEYVRQRPEVPDQDKGEPNRQGVFKTLWGFGAARFNEATVALLKPDTSNIFGSLSKIFRNFWLCMVALFWAVKYHTFYSIAFFAIIFVVFTFAGGAICRSTALEYGLGEKPGLLELLSFSAGKFGSFLSAPLITASIMTVFGFFVYVLGLMANIPAAGELILSVGLGIALIFGLLTLLMLIGTVAGGNIMLPVVAYEGSDGYDAVSRSLRYVFSQPWWMLFYTLIATLCGIISYLFVRLFIFFLLSTTYGIVELGVFNDPESTAKLERIWTRPTFIQLLGPSAGSEIWSEQVAAGIIRATVLFVVAILAAFVISFYFSASTVIYSLIRRKIDNVPINKVYTRLEKVQESVDAPEDASSQLTQADED